MKHQDVVELANNVINDYIRNRKTKRPARPRSMTSMLPIAILTVLTSACFLASAIYFTIWLLSISAS